MAHCPSPRSMIPDHAVRRLSYTGVCPGCPTQYQTFQISPHAPSTSRCSHQPTSEVCVAPSRAPHSQDFHLFVTDRVGHVAMPPVSVSPDLNKCTERTIQPIGSNGVFQLRAPVAAVPAPLRAYGYSIHSLRCWQHHRPLFRWLDGGFHRQRTRVS